MTEFQKNINNLLNLENHNKSNAKVETLILTVLNKYLKDQNKEFYSNFRGLGNERSSVEVDGYAPQGFDEYDGETVIEIKLVRTKEFLMVSRKTFIDNIVKMNENVKNIIYIFILDLTSDEKDMFIKRFSRDEIRLFVWDIKELEKVFGKYTEYVNEISENIQRVMIDKQISESINKTENDWKLKRSEHLVNLKKRYDDDDLILFLGAGISIDAKIATWDQLISDLLVTLISNKLKDYDVNLTELEKELIITQAKEINGNSPLLQARYIRTGLENIFTDTLTSILYKNCIDTSEILKELAQLCLPVRNGMGVQAVVTYNFDDLIEFNFDELRIKYRSIFREGERASKKELDIFHVHGFLPRDSNRYENLSKGLLVFSEEGYHNLMLDPYNWANIVQLNYLRENTCLFIGLSLTDPNLRRLLDITARKQESESTCKHYAILKRDASNTQNITDNEINIGNIKVFDMVNNKLQEESFKELGINIIWIEDHKEIPSILKKIKE